MWKNAAKPWGPKKIASTVGVREFFLFSTVEKIEKNFPHTLFHIVTKRGGIVEKIIFTKMVQTRRILRQRKDFQYRMY